MKTRKPYVVLRHALIAYWPDGSLTVLYDLVNAHTQYWRQVRGAA